MSSNNKIIVCKPQQGGVGGGAQAVAPQNRRYNFEFDQVFHDRTTQ